jgi:hypothetical protein
MNTNSICRDQFPLFISKSHGLVFRKKKKTLYKPATLTTYINKLFPYSSKLNYLSNIDLIYVMTLHLRKSHDDNLIIVTLFSFDQNYFVDLSFYQDSNMSCKTLNCIVAL